MGKRNIEETGLFRMTQLQDVLLKPSGGGNPTSYPESFGWD
jgi:hypothetical protein